MIILERLKALRRQRGITQAELAAKMNVTQSVIAMWERGMTMPTASKLPELANILGCSIDALFGRDDSERGGEGCER